MRSPTPCRSPPRWRRRTARTPACGSPTRRSRCTAGSASPGSTTCTSSSSGPPGTQPCSEIPSGTVSRWPSGFSPTSAKSPPSPSGPQQGQRALGALGRISVAAIGTSVADLEAETRKAEAAGVECVWAPELFRSSVTQAAYLAAKTERVDVGTGIAWAFTRSPFILAVTALDVDEMSGGRFRLGIGAGVKRLNETWHGVEYGRPAPHLRETVEAVRLIMQKAHAGEPIRFQGDYHDIDIKGWVRPHPSPRELVPIYTAAVREGMARMAGDCADGLIGHPMCSLRWLDEILITNFEQGLARSGRERGYFDFIPTV